jgi:hypothetical protein
VFNFATHQGTLTSSLPGLGWQEIIQDGTTVYVKLAEAVGGKAWIKSDATTTLQRLAGINPSSASEGDPTSALDYLRGVGADLRKVGTAKVRGVSTTHYRGTADLQAAADKSTDPSRKAIVQLVAKQIGVTVVPIEVWIDKPDRMRQLRTTLDASKFNVPSGVGLAGTMTSTVELYDFGVGFNMPPLPPPEQIADVNPSTVAAGGPGSVGGLANPTANPTGAPNNGPATGVPAAGTGGPTTAPGVGGGSTTPGPSGAPGGVVIGQPGPPSPIVIGWVGSNSGLVGEVDKPRLDALQAWVGNIDNKGGLLGHPVQLVAADDKGDPNANLAALQDLVGAHHVVALVASSTVANGEAYLRSVGVPMIGTSCGNAIDFASPVIFPPCPTVDTQVYGAVRTGLAHNPSTKLSVLYCEELSSCSDTKVAVVDHLMAANAGATVTYPPTRFSMAAPTMPCGSSPDLSMVAAVPSALTREAKTCTSYTGTYVETSPSVRYSSKDEVGSNTLLLASSTFPFIGSVNPAEVEFQQVMKSLRRPPGPAESLGWTAAKEFEVAATRAAQASKAVSPSALISALQGFNNETLSGLSVPLNFAGGHAAPSACWFALQASGGSWSALNGGQAQCR